MYFTNMISLPWILTVNTQVARLPAKSTASHITLVFPIPNWFPDSGSHVTVESCLELSEAFRLIQLTTAVGLPRSVSRDWLLGQFCIVGSSASVKK